MLLLVHAMHKSPVLLFQKINISAFNTLGIGNEASCDAIDSIDVATTGPFYLRHNTDRHFEMPLKTN